MAAAELDELVADAHDQRHDGQLDGGQQPLIEGGGDEEADEDAHQQHEDQEGGAAPGVEAALLADVLHGQLLAVLVAEDGLMLGTVELEGTADILHEEHEGHIADEEDHADGGHAEGLQEAVVLGKVGDVGLHDVLVEEGGQEEEQADHDGHGEEHRHHHNGGHHEGGFLLLFGGAFRRSFRRIRGGFGRLGDGLNRVGGDRLGGFGSGLRLQGNGGLFGCGRGFTLLGSLLGGFFGLLGGFLFGLFLLHLGLQLFKSRDLGGAHEALVAEGHGVDEAHHAADDGPAEDSGAFLSNRGKGLQDDLALWVTDGHGGGLGAPHHDALHERLTADGGLSHGTGVVCMLTHK